MNLTDFLLARIAEDEAGAQVRTVSHRMISGKMVEIPMYESVGVWAWSPDRVLAECEAKRRIVEWYEASRMVPHPMVHKLLAIPYADHPDYRQEWRP